MVADHGRTREWVNAIENLLTCPAIFVPPDFYRLRVPPPCGVLVSGMIGRGRGRGVLGFKPEDIRLLLITHAHIDHAGTLAYFKKFSGAKVAVMDRDFEHLKSGGRTDPSTGKRRRSTSLW